MTDPRFSEISLDRACEYLLDMDTLYRSSVYPDVVGETFKDKILNKYDVGILPDLVRILFEHEIPQRLYQVDHKDVHCLMRMCYFVLENEDPAV